MEIKNISLHELRKMNGSEGLVLQGCGGDLQEWVDGVNDMLTESGILRNGSRFERRTPLKTRELLACCSLLTMFSLMPENWRYGGLKQEKVSAAHGCRITFPIISADLLRNKLRIQKFRKINVQNAR